MLYIVFGSATMGRHVDRPLRVWNEMVCVGADSISALGMQDNIADGWEFGCDENIVLYIVFCSATMGRYGIDPYGFGMRLFM